MNVLASALILLWTSGPSDAGEVEQPSWLWRRQGEDAEVACSHTKGAGYYQMYWFRQLPGDRAALVVFTAAGQDKHDFGGSSTQKFSASKPDALSGSLTVLKAEPADQGVYFCAVGAQCCRRARRFDKNPTVTPATAAATTSEQSIIYGTFG